MYKVLTIFILLFIQTITLVGQDSLSDDWINTTLDKMSEDEMIGQLFMIRAHSNKGKDHKKHIMNLINKYHIGGLCFFQGTPEKQSELINDYQKKSKIPLLVSIDGEWDLGMRFPKTAFSFPRQLTLGAIKDNTLIYEMGLKVAEHCRRVGVQFNFAPVVDVNNNPNNPVINNRSFGEDVYNVSRKSNAYMQGMQDGGILACAKHFPGHGDTDVDSHKGLPIINHSMARLDSIELVPFKHSIKHGISSIMAAHLHIPAIDDRPDRATSISKKAITTLLRDSLNFEGLIVTDALEMQGVAKYFEPGQLSAEALLAGNDILLLPNDVVKGISSIKNYIKEGKISIEQIKESVKRILKAKYEVGLSHSPPKLETEGLNEKLNDAESIVLKQKMIENAITLVRDEQNIIPFMDLGKKKFASLVIGSVKKTRFQERLDSYIDCKHFNVSKDIAKNNSSKLYNQLKKYDFVLVAFTDMSKYASKNHGISESAKELVNKLSSDTELIINIFGSPYALKYFPNQKHLLVAYEEEEIYQDVAVQALFGAIPIMGSLPVSASNEFRCGDGIYRQSLRRLGYATPEYCMMSSDTLQKIDKLIDKMIKEKAAPGCQIMALRNGKVVFEKAYGYFTYDKKHKVEMDDIYDLASVTKVMASTISLMKLEDMGKFNTRSKLVSLLPVIDTSNKRELVIEDILAHQARLKSWIPFFKNTMTNDKKNPKQKPGYYSPVMSDSFPIHVAKDLYLRKDYRDTIWQKIYASPLYKKTKYKYSDLTFYLMERIIKKQTGVRLDTFVNNNFYSKLNLKRTGFIPLRWASLSDIAPTEKDNYFRKRTVHGYVHDMGAAMLGGVSGHAGLFSNARDLAVLTQMLLNGGYYGGVRFIKPNTINKYTTRFFKSSRRGMGFDLKELNSKKTMNMSEDASDSTFGHLGFTGTVVFADPDYDLIFIMLSNRTYPSMKNNKYGKHNYRPKVQSILYSSMLDKKR